MACKVPPHDWRAGITPGRVAAAVVAGGLATVGIALDTDQIAGLLITVAAVLFATQFGIPMASAMAVGHPIGGVFAALSDREQLVTLTGKRLQHSLTEVAHYVTGDRTRATDLAMLAIEDAARHWRGRLTQELDNYLLCHAAHLAILDPPAATPAEEEVQAALAARRHRAIVALRRRGVAAGDVATWLSCPIEEVAAAERGVAME
jgi:hypothetical protein